MKIDGLGEKSVVAVLQASIGAMKTNGNPLCLNFATKLKSRIPDGPKVAFDGKVTDNHLAGLCNHWLKPALVFID